MLLDTVNTVLASPLTRADLIGTFAGLRPLLRGPDDDETERPFAPARDHRVVDGHAQRGRRQAHHVSADGAGRRRRGSRRVASRRTAVAGVAHPRAAPRRRVAASATRRDHGARPPGAALWRRGAVRRRLPTGRAAARGVTAAGAEWGVARRGRPDRSTTCSTGARGSASYGRSRGVAGCRGRRVRACRRRSAARG